MVNYLVSLMSASQFLWIVSAVTEALDLILLSLVYVPSD